MKFIYVLVLFITATFSIANDIAVQGTGYGISENEALTRAKQEALSRGIGQTLISSTEVENYMVKKDLIISETMGHIKSVKVLEKVKGEDGAFKITVQAIVSKGDLRKDLAKYAILLKTIDNPKVAIMINETYNEKKVEEGAGEVTLIKFLRERSFDIVDPNQVLRFSESKEGQLALGGDPEALSKIGKNLNADVVIVGSVESQETDLSDNSYFKDSGMKSSASLVRLKAFEVSTRSILATGKSEASTVHPNPKVAAQKAGAKAFKKVLEKEDGFFDDLISSWQKQANNGKKYHVDFSGVSSFSEVGAIKKTVSKYGTEVKQMGYADGVLKLEFSFSGSIEDLGMRIESSKVNEKALKIKSFNHSHVEVLIK